MTTIFKFSTIIVLSIICSCANNTKQEESKTSSINNTEQEEEVKHSTITNTVQEDSIQAYIDQQEGSESLNDIRFAHWTYVISKYKTDYFS